MRRFKQRDFVANVGSGRDAYAPDMRRRCVAQIVAVEVHRRNHIKLIRAQEQMLEDDIGDAILDDNLAFGLPAVVLFPQLIFGNGHVTEFLGRQLVTPLTEGALRELLDVALMHQRDRLPATLQGIADGLPDQAF